MPVGWSKTNKLELAKFVNSEAASLVRLGVNRADLIKTKEGQLELIKAIYEALVDRNINYALEPFNPLQDGNQLIRTPIEILNTPREGTCLDLAVLFCSLCLGYELLPYIIVIEGHALAAVSLKFNLRKWDDSSLGRKKERALFQEGEPLRDADEFRKLIESGSYVAIECTGFARSTPNTLSNIYPEGIGRTADGLLSFERACEAGREQLNHPNRQLVFALDISIAHFQWSILPPPFPYLQHIWSRVHEERLYRDPKGLSVNAIGMSADGQVLASGDENGIVRVWDLGNNKEISAFEAHQDSVNSIVVTRDSNIIITGGESGYGKVWHLSSEAGHSNPERLHNDEWHSSEIRSIAISRDYSTQILVSGSEGGSIEVRSFKQEIVGSENIITIHKCFKFLAFKTFKGAGFKESVHSLSISGSGKLLVLCTGTKRVKVWRLNCTNEDPYDFPEMHDESVQAVAISGNGHIIVSGDKSGQMKIWNLTTNSKQSCESDSAINSLAIVDNGRFFISGNKNGQVEVWDSQGIKVIRLGGHAKPVRSVAISSDGRVVASSSEGGEVKVWKPET